MPDNKFTLYMQSQVCFNHVEKYGQWIFGPYLKYDIVEKTSDKRHNTGWHFRKFFLHFNNQNLNNLFISFEKCFIINHWFFISSKMDFPLFFVSNMIFLPFCKATRLFSKSYHLCKRVVKYITFTIYELKFGNIMYNCKNLILNSFLV